MGDQSILIDLSSLKRPLPKVHAIAQYILNQKNGWINDVIPGLETVLIRFNHQEASSQTRELALNNVEGIVEKLIAETNPQNLPSTRIHKLQVCYHPDVAPDLVESAKNCGISSQEFINLHKTGKYSVDIVGFMPGFAYFSGLNPKLKLPRKSNPRASVPKGSVAIAELQTAIYPRSTPGGWNLIGKSPACLFSVDNDPPSLFMPGDQLMIEEVSLDQLHAIENNLPTNQGFKFDQSLETYPYAIQIISPGLLTSVQDTPRNGLGHLAVGTGGAVDQASLALANTLVGNPENTEVLEITAIGPRILFKQDTLIAWVGTNCSAFINQMEIKGNRPVWIKANSTLSFAQLKPGFRIALAISGGFDLPLTLGKKGSHLSADIGYPATKKFDVIPLKNPHAFQSIPTLAKLAAHDKSANAAKWGIPPPYLPTAGIHKVHALPGLHLDFLSKDDRLKFWDSTWIVSNQSNRMGIRLESESQLSNTTKGIPSQGISMGSIQLPPSNQPIILLAEHQTTGGYPLLADIIQSDFPILAQLKPGDQIKLVCVDLKTAEELNDRAERHIENIILSIKNNYRDNK